MPATTVREREQATRAYHQTLTRLGLAAHTGVLNLWRTAEAVPSAQTQRRIVATVLGNSYSVTARLAILYFQLLRAMSVGSVAPADGWPASPVTVRTLREMFARLTLGEYEPGEMAEDYRKLGLDRGAGGSLAARLWQARLKRSLDYLTGRLDQVNDDDDLDPDGLGDWLADEVERIAMDGARDLIHDAVRQDRTALGWVRVSKTGTPCGFCSMLISRGLEFKYRSEKTATGRSREGPDQQGYDGSQYHRKCRCIAVPVWDADEYETSDQFTTNRELADAWQTVTRGESGADARQVWRNWIDKRNAPLREAAKTAAERGDN
ncbi:VG15 protein [Salininema proteolyticum]|uniref:Minor capsid protein n=1 Tax=Salininema proteolyticum TaxID=1607685 RepID=A0ABV8U073_9ACTN